MPWGAIQLIPGVDVQKTLAANQAGVSVSQLIRYKEKMIQTIGGWVSLTTVPSVVRDIHPWQGIGLGDPYISLAATGGVTVYNSSGAITQDITPQTFTTNPTPNFSISSGSNLVTVVDGGSSATTFNTVYFNTPVSIGPYLLNGAYRINSVGGSSVYTLAMSAVSSVTILSSGTLPIFTTSSGSGSVLVSLSNNNFTATTGLFQQFIAPTSVGGLTIQGPYQIASVIDSTEFRINATAQASATATATMNASLAQLVYYVTIGPAATGVGFGGLGFGLGGFGGVATSTPGTGTPITALDWTQDNWGGILMACPEDGPIYIWAPDLGIVNAQVITQAPFFNGGIFISMPQQILVAWRSTQSSGVQDPLRVRWCNAGDYTNWTVSNQTTAGSFQIPTGSKIVGGRQCPQFGMISTDIDVWVMTYVGGQVIFNFNRVGSGCGWASSHACGILGGNPYWMSNNNFFTLSTGGVVPLPCPVWDQVFQNLSTANQYKVRCGVNSAFNEINWFYPSAASTGENDSYVKVHIEGSDYEWDYGTLSRTAWADVSIVGMPLGTDETSVLYQHEMGTAITGVGLPSFQTGYWVIAESEEIPFVDLIVPDFIYGLRSGAQDAAIQITFFGADSPNDVPTIYGPYTVTSTTEFINTRIRNRLLSARITASVSSEFWRIGRIRFRFGISGRR